MRKGFVEIVETKISI